MLIVCILFMVTFALQQQDWVVVIVTKWLSNSKIFSTQPFAGNICHTLS